MEKLIYTNSKGESVEISHSSLYFLQSVDGLGAIRNHLYTNKGIAQDGVTVVGQSLDFRDITIVGKIEDTNKDNALQLRQKLLRVFNPKLGGVLRYQLGDFIREIDCKIEHAPNFPASDSAFKPFIIQLFCPNPFWRNVDETKEEIALWVGDFEFELELTEDGIEMGHRELSLIVNVLNRGDVPCGMKIEFKALATVVNPSLINVNTQEYLKLNKTMSAGEVITVTTGFGSKKVLSSLNGVISNAFNYLDLGSTFLHLDVGDNLFRYDAEENLDNLEVSIYFTPIYLGV